MDTWRSDNADDTDGEVIEIIPVEEYDFQKAKVKASLSWVLHKAYQDNVPKDFLDPFYETGEGLWQIKPRLANLLANSELYCQACRNMFGENASQWQGHWSIIQVLSRKGIYAVGSDSVDVTETILMQSAPFKIKAHLALIDALMQAFSQEVVTVERATQVVRRFASFNASSELPNDTEETILFWVNKVCVTVQRQLDKGQETLLEGGETNQKVRIVSSRTPRDSMSVPIMESLLKDMGDGCSIATLISFYCPQILHIEDVCLKSNVGIADSLYNLRLIRTFCGRHLPDKTCHLSYEDMLYTNEAVRTNIIVMLAEIFYWFEMKRLDIVKGGKTIVTEGGGNAPDSASKLQSPSTAAIVPSLPISNVTKQSFQRVKGDSELRCSGTPDSHRLSPGSTPHTGVPPRQSPGSTPHTGVPPRQALLHRRQQQGQVHFPDDLSIRDSRPGVHRTSSLTSQDLRGSGPPRQSTLAWQSPGPSKHLPAPAEGDHSGGNINLLYNVSIDSELDASFSSGSIDLGDLDTARTPRADTDRTSRIATDRSQFDETETTTGNVVHFSLSNKQGIGTTGPPKQKTPYPEQLNMSSVNSGMDTSRSNVGENQRVDESGELSPRTDMEPLMPARLRPAKEKTNNHSKAEELGETTKRKTPSPPKEKRKFVIDPQLGVNDSADNIHVTPLPPEELSEEFEREDSLSSLHERKDSLSNLHDASQKKFDAFFVRGSVTDSVADSQDLLTQRSDVTVAESYVIDHSKTPEAARAAGIPIIDDVATRHVRSREGSVASSKSSGEFSDHESHKIHSDHKTKESVISNNNNGGKPAISMSDMNSNCNNQSEFTSPDKFIIQKPVMVVRQPQKDGEKSGKGLATNFAQIKQMKDIGQVDHSGLIYMQHGKEDNSKKSPLKETFQRNKTDKKTSFAPLPNQTTWQQNSNGSLTNENGATAGGSSQNGTASQELLKIKMKLEEKRKAIERKKHTQDIQTQRMRQRLGKAAFLHVVAKPKDDNDVPKNASQDGNVCKIPDRMVTSEPDLCLSSSSTMSSSRESVVSVSPHKSPTVGIAKVSRPFSRDGMQQTIDNVRKKWFNNDDLVAPRMAERVESESPEMFRSQNSDLRSIPSDEHVNTSQQTTSRPVSFDRRSASVERISTLADQRAVEASRVPDASPRQVGISDRRNVQDVSPRQVGNSDRRSVSMERTGQRYQTPDVVGQQRPMDASDYETDSLSRNTRTDVANERRSMSVDRAAPRSNDRPASRDLNNVDKSESYGEYNSSLDKLNQSLTDLQGEIMKLSLKQGQRKPEILDLMSKSTGDDLHQRSRSRSPPRVLDVRQKTLPDRPVETIQESADDRSRSIQPSHSQGQGRSLSEPRQVPPEPIPEQQAVGSYQSSTLPRHPASAAAAATNYNQNQVPPYIMQNQVTVAGPTGPVYPSHFVPAPGQTAVPPTAQQYGSYIMGPSPHQQMGHLHQQQPQSMVPPYQQSPPHMYPGSGAMYPGQPFPSQQIMSPQTQQYPISQFQPVPHMAGTYTTSALPQQIPFTSPVSQQNQPFNPAGQYMYQQQQQQQQPQQQQQQQVPPQQEFPSSQIPGQQKSQYELTGFSDSNSNVGRQTGLRDTVISQADSGNISLTNTVNNTTSGDIHGGSANNVINNETENGKFFIAMNESSPRRMKTKTPVKSKSEVSGDTQAVSQSSKDYGSSVIADFAQKHSSRQQTPAVTSAAAREPVETGSVGSDKADAAVGFLIGQDETTLDQSTEEEMQKKKEKFERMRLKRQEEQDRKRLKLEQDMTRKREAERLKQEESERRKIEEKARREQIFKQYITKKEEEEEGVKPREKPRQKPRPKSMFVKPGAIPDLSDGVDASNSTEDLSSRAYTIAAARDSNSTASARGPRSKFSPSNRQAMRKAVSMNTLSNNQSGSMSASGDGKSLAFGGLTHRRPPSPDLYRHRNKGPRSNDGSDHGEYSGPKLFVKPSSKSNRHIIINAISHCCLAGTVNTDPKNKVLEEIAKSNAKHFMILFRDASCGYRGLYGFDPDTEDCIKITGVGPRAITNDMVEKYFKYNSGGKTFSYVASTKHLSVSIDAIALQNSVWKPSKAPAKGFR